MENENAIGILAICLSILACIGIGAYAYFDQPSEVDLSDVYENRVSINTLISNMYEIEKDIEDIDCDISQSDLNDLEDDLEEYCDDEIEDECDCIDGEPGTPCDMTIVNANTADIGDIISCLEGWSTSLNITFEQYISTQCFN